MFTKETRRQDGNYEVLTVQPSRVGEWLTWLTFGWYLPVKTYRRDFGGHTGQRLEVRGKIRLIVEGNLFECPQR